MAAFSAEIRAIIRAIIKYTEAKTTVAWLTKTISPDKSIDFLCETITSEIEQNVAAGLKSLWIPHQLRNIPPDESFLTMAKISARNLIDDHNFGDLESFVVNVEHAREIRDEINLATANVDLNIACIRGLLDCEMRHQIAMMQCAKK